MKQIQVSNQTNERFQELKLELFGAQIEDETAIYLIADEILEE